MLFSSRAAALMLKLRVCVCCRKTGSPRGRSSRGLLRGCSTQRRSGDPLSGPQQRRLSDEQRSETVSGLSDRSLGGEVSHDGDFMIFEGNRYSRKGFLFKSFAMSAVVRNTFIISHQLRALIFMSLLWSTVGGGVGFYVLKPPESKHCGSCLNPQ